MYFMAPGKAHGKRYGIESGNKSTKSTTSPRPTKGPSTGFDRVSRGGSWDFDDWFCRSAVRSHFTPDSKFYIQGFRLVRTP